MPHTINLIHKRSVRASCLWLALDRPPPPSRHYYTRSLLKMFAVANTSALRVSAKAPVPARRTVAPKAALVADLKKVAKKAAPAILTATTIHDQYRSSSLTVDPRASRRCRAPPPGQGGMLRDD